MSTPHDRAREQQRDEDAARYSTQVSDWNPRTETFDPSYSPRPHPSEAAARAYAADIFKRKKCNVQVIAPRSKGGAIVEDLRFDPETEKLQRDERVAESYEGAPAVTGFAVDPEGEAA
jgi:hypothetical protein